MITWGIGGLNLNKLALFATWIHADPGAELSRLLLTRLLLTLLLLLLLHGQVTTELLKNSIRAVDYCSWVRVEKLID